MPQPEGAHTCICTWVDCIVILCQHLLYIVLTLMLMMNLWIWLQCSIFNPPPLLWKKEAQKRPPLNLQPFCGLNWNMRNIQPWFVFCFIYNFIQNLSFLLHHAGKYVERQLCRDAILPMPVVCEVPCPKDCVLSPWTPWSLCSHTCSGKNTEGKQTRARSILAYNAGEGRNSLKQENKAASGILLVGSDRYMVGPHMEL